MTMMITELRSTAYAPDFEEDCDIRRQASGSHHQESPRVSPHRPVQNVTDAIRVNTECKKREDEREFEKSTTEQAAQSDNSSVSQVIRDLLVRSGYPLANVQCHCFDQSLELSGSVTQYYYLQVALEIAKQSAGGRQLDLQVQVKPPLTTLASSDHILC